MLVPSPISRGAFDQLSLFGSRVLNRSFMTSAHLCKGTRQRPRALVSGTGEKSKLRRDSVRQLIISTNRKKWEQSNALLASLQGKHPSSKVYMASKYEPAKLSLADAVNCLRDAAQPDMFDCMENPLRAKFTLNMRTKKKTKCIQSFEAHVVFPHTLDFLPKRKVIAICKDDDEAKLALASGAIHAGSTELISRLQHGAFHWDEYDAVVAHSVWTGSLGKLRTVLKSRLPTPNNGKIGDNILELVAKFSDGVTISSSSLEGVPEIAFLDTIIGQLTWDVDRLNDNLQACFDIIDANKSSRIAGQVVSSVELFCPPTDERFALDLSCFIRTPTDSQPLDAESDEELTLDAQTELDVDLESHA